MRSSWSALAVGIILMATTNRINAELPMLKAQGEKIVDARGETVRLRGINLGGWLVEEMWMQPFVTKAPAADGPKPVEVKDHVTLWRTIEERLGAEAVVR